MTNDMQEVERQVDEILKPREPREPHRRPVVAALVPSASEVGDALHAGTTGQEDPSITERLKTISGHLHLLHSYVANRADALESKLDQIIAILK